MKPAHPGRRQNRFGPPLATSGGTMLTAIRARRPGDCREADGHSEEHFTAGEPLPAPARRFGITDPQQWIDLCG